MAKGSSGGVGFRKHVLSESIVIVYCNICNIESSIIHSLIMIIIINVFVLYKQML